jgi:ubiquinone biosynthesis protein
MFYFIVRVGVNVLALWLTFMLLPGLTLDVDPQNELTPENFMVQRSEDAATTVSIELEDEPKAPTSAAPTATPSTTTLIITGATSTEPTTGTVNGRPLTPSEVQWWLSVIEIVLEFMLYVFLALAFAFWNWLLWPLVLALTGRLLLWSFGLFLIVINAVLFYGVALFAGGENVIINEPVWFWAVVGATLFTLLLVLLEGITGLDSPLKDKAKKRPGYWRMIGKLTFGGRNIFAENLRIAQSLDTIVRYLKDIAFDLSPFGPVRRFFQRIIYRKKHPYINESTPEMVRFLLQDLGPTYVKLGQIISSRAEQLPPEWRVQLAQLQSEVEPFPWEEAAKIIESELRQPLPEVYAAIEHEPLAAASTAQVHVASLLSGEKVVVKVQRPDIDITVRADLNVMRDLTRLLSQRFAWARNTDLNGIMTEYADNILLELDYTNEAFSGRLLAQNMTMFPTVHIPVVYTRLSTRRVMTQEFVRGVKITNTDALDQAGIDRTAVAVTFMRAIVKQVLYDGFFHGDPHPGNVLVDTASGEIIFLDMGMMGTLPTEKRMAMVDLLWSLSARDPQEIARVVLRLTTSYGVTDEAQFIEDVERLLRRYLTFADSALSMGAAVQALFDALNRNGLRMDADLTLALKAMIQAEETVSRLDPSLPLIDTAFSATKELLVETFDADKVIASLRKQVVRAAKEAIRNIPAIEDAALNWITQLRKGGITINVDTSEVSKQVAQVDASLTKNIRRLTVALLLVGLLIGGGIASTTPSDLFPNMAEFAYFVFMAAAGLAAAAVLRVLWQWLNGGEL